jgi:hypothetical protein
VRATQVLQKTVAGGLAQVEHLLEAVGAAVVWIGNRRAGR